MARHIDRLADYPTVAIGGISVNALRQCGDRRRQYAVQAPSLPPTGALRNSYLQSQESAMNDYDVPPDLIRAIAIEGQQKLLNSHVLIVGLGGFSPAAYLAGAASAH